MLFTSLMLTAAMCVPVTGRKEIVSSLHEQSQNITYLSGKMADIVGEEKIMSFFHDVEGDAANALFRKTIFDRGEKLGLIDADLAKSARYFYEADYRDLHVEEMEKSLFGERLSYSGVMCEYDDASSRYVETVKKVDDMEEQKPVEEELSASGHDWVGDTWKNYTTGIFPIYPYNPEKVIFLVNGTYMGEPFVGLRVSADGCIALVDSIDSFLNFITVGAAISGTVGKAITALAALMPTVHAFLTGATLHVASILLYLHSIIGPLWAKISTFLSTTPIGAAIAIVLTLLAFIVLSTVIELFVHGVQGRDYMNGAIIHGWFNFEYVSTDPTGLAPLQKSVLFS